METIIPTPIYIEYIDIYGVLDKRVCSELYCTLFDAYVDYVARLFVFGA